MDGIFRQRKGTAEVPTMGGREAGWKGSNFEEKVPRSSWGCNDSRRFITQGKGAQLMFWRW